MRNPKDPAQQQIILGDLARADDKMRTKHLDRHGLRIVNNAPAKDDRDYTTLNQLNPIANWNVNSLIVGQIVAPPVRCHHQNGVRIMHWSLVCKEGPTGLNNIFDIRILRAGGTDWTKAKTIFPDRPASKIIQKPGQLILEGTTFGQIPYDIMFKDMLVLDIIQVGNPAGSQLAISLVFQKLGSQSFT